jgi:hypothetical protein
MTLSCGGKVHQMLWEHLWVAAEIPCCTKIEYQNGRRSIPSKLVRFSMVVGSQTLKTTVGLFPIDSIGTSPILTLILTNFGNFGNTPRPNNKTARSGARTTSDYPITGFCAGSNLRFAGCQRYQSTVDTWRHSVIVLQYITKYSTHRWIVRRVSSNQSRAIRLSEISVTNS